MNWNGQSPVFECFGMGFVCACCALQSKTGVTALNVVRLFKIDLVLHLGHSLCGWINNIS